MLYLKAFIAIIFLLPEGASALSLDEALTTARNQATQLQTLKRETQEAEAVYQQSSQAFLPKVTTDAAWLRADSSLITGVPVPVLGIPPRIENTDLGPLEGSVVGVQVTQPIFNADALQQREAARLNVSARQKAQQWGQQALRLEVARRYFNILRLERQESAARLSYTAAQEAYRLAKASYRQGMVGRLDMEQAKAQRAAADARAAQAQSDLMEAKYQLKNLLGMAPQASLNVNGKMPRPHPPVTEDDARPRRDLQARQLAVDAAEAKTSASQAEWIPRVNLLARQQWAQGNQPLEDNADGWLVAVNLQWTLFDGFGREGRIAESRAQARKAQVEMEDTRRRIHQEQAMAVHQWQTGYTAWQAAEAAEKAAESAARLALRRYEEGLGSMTELLAAQARFDQQQAALIDARYRALLAGMNYHLQNGRDPLLALDQPSP
ncbi:TolC family protein [Halomonas sp. BLK-85]